MKNVPRTRWPHGARVQAVAAGLALVASTVIVSAAPAAAAADPWESQSGIYHYFTVPKADVPSNACGNSTGAGAELEGNIGPSGTWAAVGLDASGANCRANVGPLEPGLYYYQYVATMPDRSKVVFRNPDSPIDVTSHPNWNTLFVPGPEVAWMDDVATGGGAVSELAYTSPVDDSQHSATVWTPPDYTTKPSKAYPVLYLLADEGQSSREWLELGRAQQILDNLAVNGDLASMVVVMADAGDADFRAEVMDGLVPAVHSAYNVSGKVKQTGIAGIGRGAAQALELAASEPGVFGSVGSFSGYLSDDTHITPAQARKLNAKTDLLRFYVGNTLDANYNATYEAIQTLEQAGVRLESDGVHPETGGVWDTWRENLRDFAARAFQPHVRDHGQSAGHRLQTGPYTAPAAGSITTPHIDADGMVTFETGTQWADAKDVVLWGDWAPNGQWFRIPLTKVGDRWRTTIGPIDGYYYWRYEVNGVAFHDPADTKNVENVESQLFVPGGERTPLLADLPADQTGTVTTLTYAGSAGSSKLKVWTPVDYDPNRAEAYPVLYLYHGFGQNYASWTEVGRAAQILDNLYARGEIKPMVVVMPGYAGAPGDIWGDLSGNVMPLVSAQYNVSDDPSQRAMAGLSWGGRLTHGTMISHPGNFAYYGIFSPPFASGSVNPSTPAGQTTIATTKSVTLFAGDVDTGAVSAINGMETNLGSNGIPVVKTVIPGPHGFDVWWQGLSDLLPRIF
ncbi:alpha/beta hydrolase-fold protein [Microbacterium timonense]|uniref:alpha/beta hydrolase-fold protein n=1 Tax=Microbacterium timonense TaxID=2086576 RepID=UPI0013580969|nr:alpha/beta hydrolase-fold protein [Microbacterium timonense]